MMAISRMPLPALILVAFGIATIGCSDPSEATRRDGGTVALVLLSPNGAEGAAVLDVASAGVTGVTSGSGAVYAQPAGERLRLVLVRAQPGALEAAITMTDTTALLDARVVQVAGPTNALRASLAGYAVEVRK